MDEVIERAAEVTAEHLERIATATSTTKICIAFLSPGALIQDIESEHEALQNRHLAGEWRDRAYVGVKLPEGSLWLPLGPVAGLADIQACSPSVQAWWGQFEPNQQGYYPTPLPPVTEMVHKQLRRLNLAQLRSLGDRPVSSLAVMATEDIEYWYLRRSLSASPQARLMYRRLTQGDELPPGMTLVIHGVDKSRRWQYR